MKTQLLRLHFTAGLLLALVLALLFAPAWRAQAAPPKLMAYQGYLVDANGVPLGSTNVVNGTVTNNVSKPANYTTIFRIYSTSIGDTNDPLYAEQQTVTVDEGYFSVLLGQGTRIPAGATNTLDSLFAHGATAERYIGINVKISGQPDLEIAPRLQLITSPYAFHAQTAANLVNEAGTPLISGSGNTVTVNGTITAGSLSGNGSGLTGLTAAQIPNLDASKITTGTLRPSGGYNSYNGMVEARYGANDRFGIGMLPTIATATYTSDSNPSSSIQLGQMKGDSSFSPQLTINHGGNVGIGTTTPSGVLDVRLPAASTGQGNLIGGFGSSVNQRIQFYDETATLV